MANPHRHTRMGRKEFSCKAEEQEVVGLNPTDLKWQRHANGSKNQCPKKPYGFQQNPIIKSPVPKLNPKKSHAEFSNLKSMQKRLLNDKNYNKFGCTAFVALCRYYTRQQLIFTMNLYIVLKYYTKKSLLYSSHPQNTCPNPGKMIFPTFLSL